MRRGKVPDGRRGVNQKSRKAASRNAPPGFEIRRYGAGMRLSEFDYDLPRETIAQQPVEPRDASRLLMLDRATGLREHAHFRDLTRRLRPGDLLVLNDTRVFPARLPGRRRTGGKIEALLVAERAPGLWEALLDTPRRLKVGEAILFGDGGLPARIEGREGEPWLLRFETEAVREALERFGKAPLPPYIRRPAGGDDRREADAARYQTVYAAREGAIAAPTAGLHFTPELLDRIRAMGVAIETVTLHVGMGTFKPVQAERVEEHRMLPERYEVARAAWERIREAKTKGRRVIAVGTTSVRVLETLAKQEAEGGRREADSRLKDLRGETNLFIHAPFEFRMVDALVTNFHLPKSTLLMLVSAFAGRERVLAVYQEAVKRGYRFYSYGDAMLIL